MVWNRSRDRANSRFESFKRLGIISIPGLLILAFINAESASAQTLPRTTDGKPNLQGIWRAANRSNGFWIRKVALRMSDGSSRFETECYDARRHRYRDCSDLP